MMKSEKNFKSSDEISRLRETICCICGNKLNGERNDPDPLSDVGWCCDYCSRSYVVPMREMALMSAYRLGFKEDA